MCCGTVLGCVLAVNRWHRALCFWALPRAVFDANMSPKDVIQSPEPTDDTTGAFQGPQAKCTSAFVAKT